GGRSPSLPTNERQRESRLARVPLSALLRPRLRALLRLLRPFLRVVPRRRLEEPVERADRLARGLVVDLRVHLRLHEERLPVRPRDDPRRGPVARDDLPVLRLGEPERLRRDRPEVVAREVLRPSPTEFVGAHRNHARNPRSDKSLTGRGARPRPPCSSGSPGARVALATSPCTRIRGPRSPAGARGRTPRSRRSPAGRTPRSCGRPGASRPPSGGSSRGR